MQCITAELFPAISVKISECVQEKLLRESTFKMSDIGKEAVDDVIGRLMDKRTTNNVEIKYLEGLVQRAIEYQSSGAGLVPICVLIESRWTCHVPLRCLFC